VNITDIASNYNIVITGTCAPNDTSNNVSLVNTAPTITTEPANQTTCNGSSVSFSVDATGMGLTYQWRKGTVNLTNGDNISGATSAALTFNPVNISDTASNYNVVIAGTCSPNDTSTNVSLTVNTAPSITTEPANQTVCAGSSVSYLVAATGTSLSYQWRKGTSILTNEGTISGATSDTLTINPVNISDEASNYNVVITGTCPVNSTNVSLTVNTSPHIIIEPANQTVCAVGCLVSFSVAATGTGLTYQWRKGILNLTNGGYISGATSDTLILNPANISDTASNYNVVITGICSPASTSINASLTACNSTGIASFDNGNINKAVVIYPNPFTSSINIMIKDASQINKAELRIYDVLGKEVINTIITKQITTLNTISLPSGIYLYKVIGNNKNIQSGKLVSQQ